MRATSNRKLAEALGVSETAVRKALAAGRISREADGSFDIAEVKRQWAGKNDVAQAYLQPSDHEGHPSRGPASRHQGSCSGRVLALQCWLSKSLVISLQRGHAMD